MSVFAYGLLHRYYRNCLYVILLMFSSKFCKLVCNWSLCGVILLCVSLISHLLKAGMCVWQVFLSAIGRIENEI